MLINKRTSTGWVKNLVENKDKQHCDTCKKQLWINPGGYIYCDTANCGDN